MQMNGLRFQVKRPPITIGVPKERVLPPITIGVPKERVRPPITIGVRKTVLPAAAASLGVAPQTLLGPTTRSVKVVSDARVSRLLLLLVTDIGGKVAIPDKRRIDLPVKLPEYQEVGCWACHQQFRVYIDLLRKDGHRTISFEYHHPRRLTLGHDRSRATGKRSGWQVGEDGFYYANQLLMCSTCNSAQKEATHIEFAKAIGKSPPEKLMRSCRVHFPDEEMPFTATPSSIPDLERKLLDYYLPV